MRPVACEAPLPLPADGSRAQRVVGRLAFESPALLGGAAGRMGLSCSSCHLNGRGNPDFFIEGISNAPGTADVTSSIFSKVRGNDTFDPVAIPDLAARDGKQIRDRKSPEFRAKVHGLVVEEFDGQETPPATFEALLAYLGGLDATACSDPAAQRALGPFADIGSASEALAAADDLLQRRQVEDALLMARIARSALERAHERYADAAQGAIRDRLVAASFAIQRWSDRIRAGEAPIPPREAVDRLSTFILSQPVGSERSLYSPDVLRAALAK